LFHTHVTHVAYNSGLSNTHYTVILSSLEAFPKVVLSAEADNQQSHIYLRLLFWNILEWLASFGQFNL